MQEVKKIETQYKCAYDALSKPVKTYDSVDNAFKGADYASSVQVYGDRFSGYKMIALWIMAIVAFVLITFLSEGWDG